SFFAWKCTTVLPVMGSGAGSRLSKPRFLRARFFAECEQFWAGMLCLQTDWMHQRTSQGQFPDRTIMIHTGDICGTDAKSCTSHRYLYNDQVSAQEAHCGIHSCRTFSSRAVILVAS
ncbi:hypothetical protein CERZMDRAFT_89610, partial [Cercospora zeae-maydis SCOH1-5]